MPTALKPPVQPVPQTTPAATPAPALTKRPNCIVDSEPDGTLTVTFTVSKPAAEIWRRQSEGRDMADFVWNTWGLRYVENQRII